ncbi:chromatin complexes subunit BAP18 [Nephila pilipes]|uniref:Chromatin complexes subunit BAP18 n=1 Tax=Nephila pilipes TaxID=299642 RepID=A0A8X6U907_NEPPI|nr:chromatin complexes subunit BAP18 [Nephila pilipes]
MSFTLMGELEMMLNPEYTSRNNISETDVLALRAAITKFGEDINAICKIIKKRTILQIKGSMKRLAYEEAGLPLRKQQIIAVPKATGHSHSRAAFSLTVSLVTAFESNDVSGHGQKRQQSLKHECANGVIYSASWNEWFSQMNNRHR